MNFIFRHVKESLMARVRDYTNPYMGLIRCKFLKNKNITIISNNCWGGIAIGILLFLMIVPR